VKPNTANPLAGLEVQLESTAEQVAGALRVAILDGRLERGTYLRELPLAERFGVSRNTIREATQILVGEGLVTREMHRGAFVARLGADDARDLFRVRRVVELEAIREVLGQDLSGIQAAVRALAQAVADNDRARVVEHDLQFHRELVDLMSSSRLGGLFDSVAGELRLCLAVAGGSSYEDPQVALREHTAVLEALEQGDGALAERRLAEHLDDAERGLIGLLERDRTTD
jgi:DNA-binding GntR family transcriptional regulator